MNRILIATTILLSVDLSGNVSSAFSRTTSDISSLTKMEICNLVSDNQIISDPSGIVETCCSEHLGYCILCKPFSGSGCQTTDYSNRINISFGRIRVLPNAGRTFINPARGPGANLQTLK
ncbi:MAG: hypothetical protein QM488_13350 [Rhizobiaceae bacterium]